MCKKVIVSWTEIRTYEVPKNIKNPAKFIEEKICQGNVDKYECNRDTDNFNVEEV